MYYITLTEGYNTFYWTGLKWTKQFRRAKTYDDFIKANDKAFSLGGEVEEIE